MKLICVIILILAKINSYDSFLTFPFRAYDALDIFYTATVREHKIEENLMKYAVPGEVCNRECSPNDAKVCYFKFLIKYYQVLSG
jgi:hypothetical protein